MFNNNNNNNNNSLFTINHPQRANKNLQQYINDKNTWEIVKEGRRGYPFLVHLLNVYSNNNSIIIIIFHTNSKLYTIEYTCIIKVQNSN